GRRSRPRRREVGCRAGAAPRRPLRPEYRRRRGLLLRCPCKRSRPRHAL
ncbi:MAG: hypothetical protein AVDCRST_MAG49-3515, partial [uncultured Thermomicrobiales bacterium]